jgi:hypothetical protein
VEHTHGFTLGAAQSFVSALRQSRVRDTNSTALSQTCLRGNRKKTRSPNASTIASAA